MDDAAPDPMRLAILSLLAARGAAKTICPSEAARLIGGEDWRAAMPAVHAAVDALVAEGAVGLSWKGADLAVRDGPYRIRMRSRDQERTG